MSLQKELQELQEETLAAVKTADGLRRDLALLDVQLTAIVARTVLATEKAAEAIKVLQHLGEPTKPNLHVVPDPEDDIKVIEEEDEFVQLAEEALDRICK